MAFTRRKLGSWWQKSQILRLIAVLVAWLLTDSSTWSFSLAHTVPLGLSIAEAHQAEVCGLSPVTPAWSFPSPLVLTMSLGWTDLRKNVLSWGILLRSEWCGAAVCERCFQGVWSHLKRFGPLDCYLSKMKWMPKQLVQNSRFYLCNNASSMCLCCAGCFPSKNNSPFLKLCMFHVDKVLQVGKGRKCLCCWSNSCGDCR